MKKAMSVRGDYISNTPRQFILSKDKNVVIHCGKVYGRVADDNIRPILSVRKV